MPSNSASTSGSDESIDGPLNNAETKCETKQNNVGTIHLEKARQAALLKSGYSDTSDAEPTTTSSSNGIVIVSPMTKMQIVKNLCIICASFFLVFTSFHSMLNLQSSINKEEGIGTFSLFIACSLMMVSSMFLASVCMNRLGLKLTIAISLVTHVVFMAGNLYPVWAVIVPVSVICGLGSGPLWAAQSSYVSELAGYYATITNAKVKDSLSFFFGIFYMCINASKISGNLLASVLLKQDEETNRSMTLKEIEDCVANIQEAVDNATTLERPDDTTIYTICGTWIGLAIAGLIVLAFLTSISADGGSSKKGKRDQICTKFLSTLKHLWNSRLQKILIPVSLYYGIFNGFLIADFTRSIVGCTLGIQAVGEVMLSNGICSTISSALIGRLVNNFGHLPFFTLTFLCFGVVEVVLLVWKPGPDYGYILFIFAGMLGVADGILKTQLIAIYGHLFVDNTDAAFGSYFMLEAFGYIIAMAYSSYVSTDIKLCILLVLLVLSAISYYTVEYIDRRNQPHKDANKEKA